MTFCWVVSDHLNTGHWHLFLPLFENKNGLFAPMRIIVLFLLLLTAFFLPSAQCQEDSLPFRHLFKFDPHPDHRAKPVNDILQTIAEGSGKLRAFTSYELTGSFGLKLTFAGRDASALNLGLNRWEISGDVTYRDFSLRDMLFPDLLDATLLVVGPDGMILETILLKDVPVSGSGEIVLEIVLDRIYSVIPEVRIKDMVFHYNHGLQYRMDMWHGALSSYYEASQKLVEVGGMLDGLDASNPETLLMDEFTLCRAEEMLGEILNAPFHQWIPLEEKDPENVLPLMEAMFALQVDIRAHFNHSLTIIDRLFYEKGQSFLQEDSLEQARMQFHSALTYNPYNIPSHMALMRDDLFRQRLVPAIERAGSVHARMHPSPEHVNEITQLTDSILNSLFNLSREFMSDQRLTEALEVLSHVEIFCQWVEGYYPCPSTLFDLQSESHQGIYGSFLVVSERALVNEDLGFAETYLGSAMDYQRQHSDYVSHHDDALEMLSLVLTRHRLRADLAKSFSSEIALPDPYAPVREMIGRHVVLFQYAKRSARFESTGEAVLNYAAAGLPDETVALLTVLRERGHTAMETSALQTAAGRYLAEQLGNARSKAGAVDLARNLTGDDLWFQPFSQSLISNW